MLSELNALVRKVTDHLDEYDPTTSGRAIQDFVDDLSNWYVRRSRRRFWRGELDDDKLAAYQTLYTCLVTVAKLLAPFTPFVAESLYQNLVRSVDPDAPESVHLADWPEADEVADRPEADGRDAHGDEGRQPRPRRPQQGRHEGAAAAGVGDGVREQRLARRGPSPPRRPGDRRTQRARGERRVLSELFKETYTVPDDLLKHLPEGAALAEDSGYAVGVDTRLTPELAAEGLARELVHRIQNLRKAAGFEISDRITVHWQGPERLREVFAAHDAYLREETLADAVYRGRTPPTVRMRRSRSWTGSR